MTEHATTWAPPDADHLARHLLAVLDPDRTDRYDPAATERRSWSASTDITGMVHTTGQHDPATGAYITSAVELLANPFKPRTGALLKTRLSMLLR